MLMRTNRRLSFSLALCAGLVSVCFPAPIGATEITLAFDTAADQFPSYDPDGSKLAALSQAAANYWESLLPEGNHAYSVTLHYSQFPAGSTTHAVYNGFDHTINVRANRFWYIDPTPSDHDEFAPFQQSFYAGLDDDEQDAAFDGPAPDLLEVGYAATAVADGAADGRVDMYSVMLHEMGHFLAIGYNAFSPDVALPPHMIGNIGGVKAKREDTGHLVPDDALMDPFLEAGRRSLPSALDVIVAANEQNHSEIRLKRVEWIGDALVPADFWAHDAGWIGGSTPNSKTDVRVRNGDVVSVLGAPAAAKNLAIERDSGINILDESLFVDANLSLDDSDYLDDSFVKVHAGAVLDVEGRLTVGYGDLDLLGGDVFAATLRTRDHHLADLQPRVQGYGVVHIGDALLNDGMLRADGGTLAFAAAVGAKLDVDGEVESSKLPRLLAQTGDLEFQNAISDPYGGLAHVAGGHALSFRGTWAFNHSAELHFEAGAGTAEFKALSPNGIAEMYADVAVEENARGRIEASQIKFNGQTAVAIAENGVLSLLGRTYYNGGKFNGPGTLQQNGDATVDADVEIAVDVFDWDGNQATPSKTDVLNGRKLTITAKNLGPGGYAGRADVGANAELEVDVTGGNAVWLLAADGKIRLFKNSRLSGSWMIVGGALEAIEGTGNLDARTTLTPNSLVTLYDKATLNINAPTTYGGGVITTDSGQRDDSLLQQFAPATVLGHHLITAGFFNWDAGAATSSDTVIEKDGYLDIYAKEIGNGITNPFLALIDRSGFGDQIDVNSGVLRVIVGSEDHSGLFADWWTLNKGGRLNLNWTAHALPTIRGSRLVNHGAVSGNGQFLNELLNESLIEVGYSGNAGKILALDDFVQSGQGTLQIDLGGLLAGLSYDQLFIDDLCTLAGTLDVRLLPGFAPEPGDLFRIIEGSSLAKISGVFDKVLLPYGNDAWDVNYGDNFVELRFVAVPEPAAWTMALAACMAGQRRRPRNPFVSA